MDPTKPSHTHEHTAGCKRPRLDMALANKSAHSSETVRESSSIHDAEDSRMMGSDDDKTHTKEVLIENMDMVPDLSAVDTESPSTSAMRPTTTENIQETTEEIVKRLEQFLVSEGLIPNDTVDCQAVAEQTTDAEIEGLNPIELQRFFTAKIYKMYRCRIDKHTLNYVMKVLEKRINKLKIEISRLKVGKPEKLISEWKMQQSSELEEQTRKLLKFKNYYKFQLEATKPNNLDQRLPLTAGMSGEQENRKEEAHNKTSTELVHKKSTAVDDLNAMKINKFQVNKTGMIPTQGPMHSFHKSLSVYTKSGEGTSELPKPVTNMDKEKTNTTTQSGQVRTKRCFIHRAHSNIANKCSEVIDLTIDDD